MVAATEQGKLIRLSDTGLDVADPEEDIRGRSVVDRDGHEIGEIEDLYIDPQNSQVQCIHVTGTASGGEETDLLIPVDAIVRITEEQVHIDRTREHVHGGPRYNPDLVDATYLGSLYGYYGYAPFWGPGYVYPPYPYY
jgi:sporulation protein YlmC with PRC-barrel domain